MHKDHLTLMSSFCEPSTNVNNLEILLQKELFKSAMEVDEDTEKTEGDVPTPTNTNVRG